MTESVGDFHQGNRTHYQGLLIPIKGLQSFVHGKNRTIMKLTLCIAAMCMVLQADVYSQRTANSKAVPKGSILFGVFVGTTPCGETARPLHKVEPKADCDIIKWELTLYKDATTGSPSIYTLNSECRFFINNRDSKIIGTNTGLEGNWTITKGTKNDPDAVIYKLTGERQTELLFLKLDDNLLHPLNKDKSLMIGTSGWSYTLSKTDN